MSQATHKSLTRRNFLKKTSTTTAVAAFASGIIPIFPSSVEAQERVGACFDDIYRLFHVDYEFGNYKEIFTGFDAEEIAQIFQEAGIQMVSYFAKCASGYSYYPTEIGVEHPGLKIDFVGKMTSALKKRDIRTFIYVFPARERNLHKTQPDWIYTDRNGPTLDSGESYATMCFRTPYMDKVVIPQMKEIISRYDPDGLFVDIVLQQFLGGVCYCKHCKELFNNEVGGEIPKDERDPKSFAYRKWSNKHFETHMDKVYRALSAEKPEIVIINNYCWMSRYPITPPKHFPHICWDTAAPNSGLYAWNFSLEARYLATLTDVQSNITWSLMSTRGNTWGDYSIREPEAYMHEFAIPLAGCGRTYISDDAFPSGDHDPAYMEICSAVNKRTQELEPYIKECKPVKDVAVLHSADSVWSRSPMIVTPTWPASTAFYPVCGTHKALIEGHVQMGILNSEVLVKTLQDYKTLIIPNQRILNKQECEAIRRFVKNGGMLIATCETGTRDTNNNLLNNFSIADVLGVDLLETSGTENCYLRIKTKDDTYDFPASDVQVTGNYVRVKTITAKTLLELVPPYEGIKIGTPPPAIATEGPGVTVNSYGKGKAIYCAPQIFTSYFKEDTPVIRKLALWILGQVYPNESRTIFLENTPINVEVFFNQRGNERFVHLINYSGDKRETGSSHAQDFTTVHDISVRVKLPEKPKRVTVVPESKNIDFEYSGGWLKFEALPLSIHHVYRIEL
ncbi:beta-galactosidase trimerization domain-containing protein [Candidatus Latescibacterota bacterium]